MKRSTLILTSALVLGYGCAPAFNRVAESYDVGRDHVEIRHLSYNEAVMNVAKPSRDSIVYFFDPRDTTLTEVIFNGRVQTEREVVNSAQLGLEYNLRGGSIKKISEEVGPGKEEKGLWERISDFFR